MPALPDVPNVCRITLKGLLGGDTDVLNRFFVKYGGAAGTLTSADAVTVATGVATAWNAHEAAMVTPAYTLTEVNVEDLSSVLGAVGAWTGSHAGSDADTRMAGAVSFVVQEKTIRRFRGGHYRQYIAGVGVGHLANATLWDGTYLGNHITAYTAFRAAISATFPVGLQPTSDVGVSYYHLFTNVAGPTDRMRPRSSLRATPIVDQIASFTGNTKPGSQRRRNLQSL